VDLDPAEIRRHLRARRLGGRIDCVEETDSTNSDVAAEGRAGAAEGLVLIADAQRRGRGRLGRSWVSPAGRNLYCSVLLRPDLGAGDVPLLTLAAGVAVAEAVEAFSGTAGVMIKWPNDVLVGGRKVAGILTEMDGGGGRPVCVVVGIGVNLNSVAEDFPPEVRALATSIRMATGAPVDRSRFAAHLIGTLDARYEDLLRDGFSTILPAWSARDALRGRRVRVLVGGEVLAGIAGGLAVTGRLVLQTAHGVEEIVAGEVSVVDGYSSAAT